MFAFSLSYFGLLTPACFYPNVLFLIDERGLSFATFSLLSPNSFAILLLSDKRLRRTHTEQTEHLDPMEAA
jgi:hypothetical protein